MNNNNKRKPNEQREDIKVVQIRRVSKKTKGGNNISFTALIVTGDKKGRVGVGLGKALSVAEAIKKGSRLAQRDLVKVPINQGTIPFEIIEKFKGAHILLKPAPKGTGVIAGGPVRSVVEMAGVTDIVAKCLGGSNKMSNVFATFKAMKQLQELETKRKYLDGFKKQVKNKP